LIRALVDEHPDHHWDMVRLKASRQASGVEPMHEKAPPQVRLWQMYYRQRDVLTALPDLVKQIQQHAGGPPAVIAFEAVPDPLLRNAYPYDMRVFILPPIRDETVMFRRPHEARLALLEILRDSSALARELHELALLDPSSAQNQASPGVQGGGAIEINQSQVDAFLAEPLGAELAARVHLQPSFADIADADIVVLNAAAAPSCRENTPCWQPLLGLMGRLRKKDGHGLPAYVCNLSDPQDPSFARIRHRISQVLCRV
jgi:hypothetical protein